MTTTLPCASPYCDRDANVAVHRHVDHSVLLRWDHVTDSWAADLRCTDCAVHEIFDAPNAGVCTCPPIPALDAQ